MPPTEWWGSPVTPMLRPARDDLTDLAASFHPPPESLAGQPAGTPTLIFQASGERIWRRLEFWPFRDEHETLIGLLGVVRDPDARASVPESQANRLHVELLEIRRRLLKQPALDSLLGIGPAHRRVLEQVRLAAGTTAPVLIVGESGTGKRQVARAIHQNGPGRGQPLVPFDCEALPAEILERELFGVERSASTRLTSSQLRAYGEAATVLRRRLNGLDQGDFSCCLATFKHGWLPRSIHQVRLIGTTVLEPEDAFRRASASGPNSISR